MSTMTISPVVDGIDAIIVSISGRDIVPTGEVTDALLDLRLIALEWELADDVS